MTEVTTTQKQSLSTYYPEGKRLYPRLDYGMQEGVNVPKIAVDVTTDPPTVYEFSPAENKYVPSATLVLQNNGDVGPRQAPPSSRNGGGAEPPQNNNGNQGGGGETRQNTTTQGGKVVNLGQDNFYGC